jgi:hypothetical protein
MRDEDFEKTVAGLDPEFTEDFRRFVRLVPIDGDLLTITLKGHLLVEEQLTAIVAAALPGLEKERYREFRRKFELARAICGSLVPSRPSLWAAVGALGAVRNDLAHKSEPGDFETLLLPLFNIARGDRLLRTALVTDSVQTRLHMLAASMWASLRNMRDAVDAVYEPARRECGWVAKAARKPD